MEQVSTSERASKRFYHSIVVGVVGVAHAGNRDAKGSTRCTTGERIRDSGAASLCHHCAVASSNRICNGMIAASKGAKLWCIQTLELFCRRLSGYACGSRESMGIEFSNTSIRAPFFVFVLLFAQVFEHGNARCTLGKRHAKILECHCCQSKIGINLTSPSF